MKTPAAIGCLVLVLSAPAIGPAAEYGGRWTDENIRETSLQYIEGTKARFAQRAAQLSEFNGTEFGIEYRELTPEQQRYYEQFLEDRITGKNREGLFRMMMRDLEAVRVRLAEAEKTAFLAWEKLPKEEKAERLAIVEGDIYGTEVSASNLGVVLDNSPSMRPYLEAVRAEIRESFPNAHFREAAGSGLSIRQYHEGGKTYALEDSWYYVELPPAGGNPFDPKWHQPKIFEGYEPHYRQVSLDRNPLAAIRALIELQGVDVIYWFCDFEDEIDESAFRVFKEAVESHEVTLYVHSSGRRPKKELTDLIEASGGEVIRKRIR